MLSGDTCCIKISSLRRKPGASVGEMTLIVLEATRAHCAPLAAASGRRPDATGRLRRDSSKVIVISASAVESSPAKVTGTVAVEFGTTVADPMVH
jgi:hypothetical protein